MKPTLLLFPSSIFLKKSIAFTLIAITLGSLYVMNSVHAEPAVQRPDEMEFDARVIKGQRAEGAVYLFQRAARPLPPLLSYKRDYLGAIVSPVFGSETSLGQENAARTEEKLKIGERIKKEIDQGSTKILKRDRKKSGKNRKKWRRSKKSRNVKGKAARKSWRRRSKK